jgi:hypothetical protein
VGMLASACVGVSPNSSATQAPVVAGCGRVVFLDGRYPDSKGLVFDPISGATSATPIRDPLIGRWIPLFFLVALVLVRGSRFLQMVRVGPRVQW